jgi:tellurite methyltransferase
MSHSSSEWDQRYRDAASAGQPVPPATIVSELLPLLPHGTAVDLACGSGRHAQLLLGRRQSVVAVDYSRVALDALEAGARAAHITVERSATSHIPGTAPSHGLHLVECDLERAVLPSEAYSLVLCVQYLQRTLFPEIARALRPGGMLLFETFTRAQLERNGGPTNPAYLVEEGELRSAFPGLRVVFYRELRAEQGIASLLAQKPVL